MDKAVADYLTAIDLKIADGGAWLGRANAEAHLRQWGKAAGDYSTAIRMGLGEPWVYSQYALVCLGSGDISSYRQTCKDMLERFAATKSPTVAGLVLETCL